MLIMKGKREKTEGKELQNQESSKTLVKKKKIELIGNTGSGPHQTNRDERKNRKRIP